MPGTPEGEHSPLWGTIPPKGVVVSCSAGKSLRLERGISVMPLEGDFSEELVTMLRHQPVEPVAKRLHERKCE